MPTDVLFGVSLLLLFFESSLPFVQIFECLHPVDLYHLIQSTRMFRSIILNPRYRGVWTSAFRKHKDLPSCPEGISELQWSSLLFGPDTCDVSRFASRIESQLIPLTRSVGIVGLSPTFSFRNDCVKRVGLVMKTHNFQPINLFFL